MLGASKPRTHHHARFLFCGAGVREEMCGNALWLSTLSRSYNFSFLLSVTVVNFALSVAPQGNTVTNSRGRRARACHCHGVQHYRNVRWDSHTPSLAAILLSLRTDNGVKLMCNFGLVSKIRSLAKWGTWKLLDSSIAKYVYHHLSLSLLD